jgi:2-polyprenyl-3-methyl-5-hydroxy-6-metoxy-1,4-benzoquinol methylase
MSLEPRALPSDNPAFRLLALPKFEPAFNSPRKPTVTTARDTIMSSEQHAVDVRRRERFEFGKNWWRFLSTLTPARLQMAEESLRNFLEVHRLDGTTFLDIGSGSGLFSLAARRLGARVHSFDFDPRSVECTAELRRRYCPGDNDLWRIEAGSVLDRAFLSRLGQFDIVYSWGVLHHTGAMWSALDNVKPLVRMGGVLFISIYNDLGEVTDWWWQVKRRYNRLPAPLRLPYALSIIGPEEARSIRSHWQQNNVRAYLRMWTEYQRTSTRGMSRWHDLIDWIGGFPYERASIDAIVDVFERDGFALTKLGDRSGGIGCNEFVFRREGSIGEVVDQTVLGSRWFARRFGRRVLGSFRKDCDGWFGRVADTIARSGDAPMLLFRERRLIGQISLESSDMEILVDMPDRTSAEVHRTDYRVLRGRVEPMPLPLTHGGGHMWLAAVPHLADRADDKKKIDTESGSPVFVFEDGVQLAHPHSIHDDIRKHGRGRFSHWQESMYFASSDNSDPTTNGRMYALAYPD